MNMRSAVDAFEGESVIMIEQGVPHADISAPVSSYVCRALTKAKNYHLLGDQAPAGAHLGKRACVSKGDVLEPVGMFRCLHG
jgi:hypothetical protein